VTRHAVPIHHAVGIKANERPMNLLSPVNNTGASVTQHALNINLQDLPVGMSPLPCGVFPKYRSPYQQALFRKGSFYRGMLRTQHAPLPALSGIPRTYAGS
jgi:hypothetical protein